MEEARFNRHLGRLRAPLEGGSGIPAEMVIDDGQLSLYTNGHFLGKWPLSDAPVKPLNNANFDLLIEGEHWVFAADRPEYVSFALSAAPSVDRRDQTGDGDRSLVVFSVAAALGTAAVFGLGYLVGRHDGTGVSIPMLFLLVLSAAAGGFWALAAAANQRSLFREQHIASEQQRADKVSGYGSLEEILTRVLAALEKESARPPIPRAQGPELPHHGEIDSQSIEIGKTAVPSSAGSRIRRMMAITPPDGEEAGPADPGAVVVWAQSVLSRVRPRLEKAVGRWLKRDPHETRSTSMEDGVLSQVSAPPAEEDAVQAGAPAATDEPSAQEATAQPLEPASNAADTQTSTDELAIFVAIERSENGVDSAANAIGTPSSLTSHSYRRVIELLDDEVTGDSQPHTGDTTEDGDDLERIKGIGPAIAYALKTLGYASFADVAALDEAAIDSIEELVGPIRWRMERDGWRRAAEELHRAALGLESDG